MSEAPPRHIVAMHAGVAADGAAYRALLAGDADAARDHLRKAVGHYLGSWAEAPPRSYGRLLAALTSAVIAGEGAEVARRVRAAIPAGDSPTSCYALALAALVLDDEGAVAPLVAGMREGDGPFQRSADALAAIAARDRAAYARAVRAIIDDFTTRDAHLTGVPFADTAVVAERLAAARGMAAGIASPVMPAA